MIGFELVKVRFASCAKRAHASTGEAGSDSHESVSLSAGVENVLASDSAAVEAALASVAVETVLSAFLRHLPFGSFAQLSEASETRSTSSSRSGDLGSALGKRRPLNPAKHPNDAKAGPAASSGAQVAAACRSLLRWSCRARGGAISLTVLSSGYMFRTIRLLNIGIATS
jgi:hypothetical protein